MTSTTLHPMLASAMVRLGFDAYASDAWVLEPKFDGHRVLITKVGDVVRATGRPRAGSQTGQVKSLPAALLAALRLLPDGLYDGELMAPSGKSWDVVRTTNFAHLFVVLFDVLELAGHVLHDQPWEVRRAGLELAHGALAGVPASAARVALTPAVPVSWAAVEAIWRVGGEGAVLKRRASTYRPGARSTDWVKVVLQPRATLTITGFEAGSFGPYSVTCLRHDDGTVTQVKTKDGAARDLIARDGAAAWIGRRLVIRYKERIASGAFRHPMWDHPAAAGE